MTTERCAALCPIGSEPYQCDDDDGHDGMHHVHDGPVTVSWSDALAELTGKQSHTVAGPDD